MTAKRWIVGAVACAFLLPFVGRSWSQDDEPKKFNLIYVPTDEKVIEKMFEMGKVGKKDVVFDLGCGDGRICAMACKKFDCTAVGIDLNPERIRECMDTIKKYGVEKYVDDFKLEYRLGNALNVPDLPKASVIMLYMLPEFMDLLEPVAKKALKPGSRIISHDYRWRNKDWEPDQVVEFRGPTRTHTLYLWTVKEKEKDK
ncbi:MAG: class I SAM-dependent methyltransferase [Gemmataceae bacterium]|nr:class I SAM-dependent methyltransferase [Gemmataceae bacterium]MCI0739959.1 class I SAM-dependent methyltransferase [Gemmataceae bacterium]